MILLYIHKILGEFAVILFMEDWKNYPSAIVDLETKNKSFVRLAALYRDMGIINHSFLLALHNPELVGIDPHSEDLSKEQITMIILEIKENPWYFFREVVKVPIVGSPIPSEFKANRGNISTYWLFFNHIFCILEQIRQTGKSVTCDCLDIYMINGGVNNTQINLVTKDDTLRSVNLNRLKEIQDSLPWYINFKSKKDISNTEMMTISALNNEIRAHVPNKSPKAAYKIGRGLTSPIFRFDEAAFIDNISIILPSALSAGTAARTLAELNKQHYGTILTTTAGKKDDPDGSYVWNMIQESAIWGEHFFDVPNIEELKEIIRKNSHNRSKHNFSDYKGRGVLRVYASFNHKQLGKTDEWLYRAIEEANVKGEDADRDFFGIWTSGSILSPFSAEDSNKIRASEVSNPYQSIMKPGGYVVRWYINKNEIEQKMNSGKYVMALDTSDAIGADDIGMLLRCIETGETIAAGSFNETNLIVFAEWLVQFLKQYQNVILIPERKSSAIVIIDYLLIKMPEFGMDPFKRIYNTVVQNAHEDKTTYNKIVGKIFNDRFNNIYVEHKKSFGFSTSAFGATSRSELYGSTLESAVKYTGNLVKDKQTINQLLSLTVKNGRVDHPPGGHDDQCIAWLLSYWFMIYGRKLDHYGVDSSKILSKSLVRVNEINSGEAYDRNHVSYLKGQIDNILEEMKNVKDDYMLIKLEIKLRKLYNDYSVYEETSMSVDEMIKQVQKKRNINSKRRLY